MAETGINPSGDIADVGEQRGPAPVPPDRSLTSGDAKVDPAMSTDTVPMWKKATAGASWVVAAFFLFVVLANGGEQNSPNVIAGAALVDQEVAADIPERTLGIRFDQVRQAWNSTEQPPTIRSPLTRTPEGGELDSFFHRFDGQAQMIGAYRDRDDYLVAIQVKANVNHDAIATMFLPLCHILHPFTPECLDNYFTIGLAGTSVQELNQTGSDVSWDYEGNEWRVSVAHDELTIRVLAPDAD